MLFPSCHRLLLKFRLKKNFASFRQLQKQKTVARRPMDSHYEAQIRAIIAYSSGPARQFGSGAAGLGALAVRVGRSALPLLRKYAFSRQKSWTQTN